MCVYIAHFFFLPLRAQSKLVNSKTFRPYCAMRWHIWVSIQCSFRLFWCKHTLLSLHVLYQFSLILHCVQDFPLSYLVWPSHAVQQARARSNQSGDLHRGSFTAQREKIKKSFRDFFFYVRCDFIRADLCKHFEVSLFHKIKTRNYNL